MIPRDPNQTTARPKRMDINKAPTQEIRDALMEQRRLDQYEDDNMNAFIAASIRSENEARRRALGLQPKED